MGTDTNYSYTKNMRTLFKSSISRLKSFYCREDAERALKRVRSAPEDAVIFRTEELKKICSERDIDVKELIKNKELLEKFPTQAEMQEELLEIFYGLYKEFKNPSDYMERIVRRLASEYKDDTVRTVILKKFVIGGGFKWKAVKTNAVCDWVINRMSSYEKEHFEGLDEESRLEMIVDGINDEIFSEENLSGELSPAETIGLMVKRIKSLRDNYETADKDNKPVKVSDFKVREETRAALKAYCGEKGIYYEPNDKIIDILERVTAAEGFDDSGAKGFFDMLKDDFAKQMRTTFYGSKLKKASELYKNDKKDALTKKQAGWKLLQICDDLAKGSFKNNLGKTRVYIYYFAFMFGMTAAIRETDIRDDKTDIEKNLFEDYYCDNLVRFFESTYKDSEYLSSFEKEPAGNGINYKNFMEVIYLYYLYRTDLNLKPGQKIDRAEKKIRECIKKAEKANKESSKDKENTASDDIFSGLTSVFKRMYINSIADIDEDEIADFVSENYLIVPSEKNKTASKIMLSSEENTAYNLMEYVMEDLEYIYSFSAEHGTKIAGDDYGTEVSMDKYVEDAKMLDSFNFDWKLAGLLKEKYADDEDFVNLVSRLEDRAAVEFDRIGGRKKSFIINLLYILYYNTSENNPISLKNIEKAIISVNRAANGGMVSDGAEILEAVGFDVCRRTEKGKGSLFYLGERSYDDKELSEIMAVISKSRSVNEEAVLKPLDILLKEKIPVGKRVTRGMLIGACTSYYVAEFLDETLSKRPLPELYEDFAGMVGPKLTDARFQPMSEKNIFDMFVFISLYQYVIENGK